jgi:hypothetical protein
MSDYPDVSLILPLESGDEPRITVGWLESWFASCLVDVVIVQSGARGVLSHSLLQFCSKASSGRHVEVRECGFNRGLLINVGLHFSRASRAFIFDLNYVPASNLLADVISVLDGGNYVTVQKVHYKEFGFDALPRGVSQPTNGKCLKSFVRRTTVKASWTDGRTVQLESQRDSPVEGIRAGFNLMAVDTSNLRAIGGYNSGLALSAWAAADVQLRLRRTLGLRHLELGEVYRLPNNGSSNPTPQAYMKAVHVNFMLLCDLYAAGSTQGTLSRDVLKWKDKLFVTDLEGILS